MPHWVRSLPGCTRNAPAEFPALESKNPATRPFTEISVKALPAPVDTQPVTMSSLEIAELTGKQHKHVLYDIRHMLDELGEGQPSFRHTHRNPQNGQEYPIFRLPKDLTITLVSGYSIQMRHRIVTRWLELEEAQKPVLAAPQAPVLAPAPRTLSEALLLAAHP